MNARNKPEKIKDSNTRRVSREQAADESRLISDHENPDLPQDFQFPTNLPRSSVFREVPARPTEHKQANPISITKEKLRKQTEVQDSGFDTFLNPNVTQRSGNSPDPSENSSSRSVSSIDSTESEMAEVSIKDILAFKIPFFSGDQKELDGFINTCKMYNELTPEALKETLLNLVKAKITGDALSKIQPITAFDNIANLLKTLEETIRKPVSYEFANEDLNNIMQNREETIEAYGKRVREALHRLNKSSAKVSDNVQEQSVFRKAHEKLAISKFTQNLRYSQLRVAVAAANKATLEECIVYAMERELIEKNSNLRNLHCNLCGSNQHKANECTRSRSALRPNSLPNRFRGPQQISRPDMTLPMGITPYRFNPNNNQFNSSFFRGRFRTNQNVNANNSNSNRNNQERSNSDQNNRDNTARLPNNNNSTRPGNDTTGFYGNPQYRSTPFQNNSRGGYDNNRNSSNNQNMNQYRNNNNSNNQNRNARMVTFQEDDLCEELDLATLMDQESHDTVDRKNF